jgi:hypothetical protein
MLANLQRILIRALALVAIAAGAFVALFVALFTLITGILVGAVTLVLARFGHGPLGRRKAPPAGHRTDGAVIDVDMREIRPDENDRSTASRNNSRSPPSA